MTHLQQIKQENKQVQAQVLAITGLSNHAFCHFQEEMGYAYLQEETKGDLSAVKELVYMKTFWNWWKNQWVIRDKRFLIDVARIRASLHNSIYDACSIVNTYKQYHNPKAIFFSPHKSLMQESYARLIGKVNKAVVNG